MRFTFWVPAGHDKFAPGSWDDQVGPAIPLQFFGTQIGWAVITRASVAADGSGVDLAVEASLEEAAPVEGLITR